jgi:hypothetical protein
MRARARKRKAKVSSHGENLVEKQTLSGCDQIRAIDRSIDRSIEGGLFERAKKKKKKNQGKPFLVVA